MNRTFVAVISALLCGGLLGLADPVGASPVEAVPQAKNEILRAELRSAGHSVGSNVKRAARANKCNKLRKAQQIAKCKRVKRKLARQALKRKKVVVSQAAQSNRDNPGAITTPLPSPVTVVAPVPVKPSAVNTGVPAGHPLVVHNGDLTITTAGAVIDGLDVRGYVKVNAPNVTIRRSIFRGPAVAPSNSRGLLAITTSNAAGYLIEDVTFAPRITSPNIDGVKVNQPGTFRRVDMSGSVDGLVIYGNGVRVESSYLHDFVHFESDPNQGGNPSHDDAIQVQAGTGVTIVNNTITGAKNTAVMVTQDAGVTRDLKINSNWIDGGWCSVNYKSNGAFKTGFEANNNRFGRGQKTIGCAITHNSAMSDLVPTGNVWDDNGQPVTIKPRA